MAGNCKDNGHMGSREFIREYLRDPLVKQTIIENGGSLRESSHENLKLELAKSLTRKYERSESQSKGAEKKILIPPSCDVDP